MTKLRKISHIAKSIPHFAKKSPPKPREKPMWSFLKASAAGVLIMIYWFVIEDIGILLMEWIISPDAVTPSNAMV